MSPHPHTPAPGAAVALEVRMGLPCTSLPRLLRAAVYARECTLGAPHRYLGHNGPPSSPQTTAFGRYAPDQALAPPLCPQGPALCLI